MDGYIVNKRKIEKIPCILGIIFWIMNFIFWELSISMLIKIIIANRSKWFETAVNEESIRDTFIANRINMIMSTVLIILVVIIVFAIVTIVLYRNVQLTNMQTQIGIYTVLGYSKKRIFGISMLDPVADWIISFPISVIVSSLIWMGVSKIKAVYHMLNLMKYSVMVDLMSYVLGAILMFVVTIIHTKLFMKKIYGRGIRYMLGKGVV